METPPWPSRRPRPRCCLGPGLQRKPGTLPAAKDSVKLGLKELILRGAYRIDVKKGRWGSRKVTLLPQEGAALSSSRDCFDAALRPWTRGDVEDVIKRARKATTGG